MNILKEKEKIKETMKQFNFMLGEKTHFLIYDFKQPIKKKQHEKTTYYYFKALIKSKDFEQIPYGKHTIQLPSKRVVYPLIEKIEALNRINDKEISVTIIKKNNHNYDITIH